jgi:hypothetical protein
MGILEIPKIDCSGGEQERIAWVYLCDKYLVLNLVPFLRLKKSSWSCEKLRPDPDLEPRCVLACFTSAPANFTGNFVRASYTFGRIQDICEITEK